jgi:ribosomal protein S18 acetylase RimI-like enzyme
VSERIVALGELEDRGQLAALAERAFGSGSRRADWLARKRWREHVDPSLSQIAIDGDPDDPEAWRGYVLVGTPPSRAPAARTAGTAVDPVARGRGLGSALVRTAAAATRARGFTSLELWAEHDRVGFYERLGFTTRLAFDTLLSFACGAPTLPLPDGQPWDPAGALSLHELHAWLPEAWSRTPAIDRRTHRDHDGLAHIAKEGVSLTVHRTMLFADVLASPTRTVAWLDALLQKLPAPAPVCLVALDRVSSITLALREHGWSVAQRGNVMTLPL